MEKKTGQLIRKVAITGPESTGKSWLSGELAARFGTVFVPEFARDYLNNLDRSYLEPDLRVIAEGQLSSETLLEQEASRLLFCDTELLVIKIWSEVKYGRCDPWIQDQLNKAHYDLYLLCNIDLPWESDPLREHPHQRDYLFSLYLNEMKRRQWTFRIVSGLGEERFRNAMAHIREVIPDVPAR